MLGNDIRWRTKANLVARDLLEAYFEPAAAKPPAASAARAVHRRAR
jgi:hypothetical protein